MVYDWTIKDASINIKMIILSGYIFFIDQHLHKCRPVAVSVQSTVNIIHLVHDVE